MKCYNSNRFKCLEASSDNYWQIPIKSNAVSCHAGSKIHDWEVLERTMVKHSIRQLRENSMNHYFHKLSTNLKSDSFFPSDVKIAEPPGRIHISLTALVSGGRWILRTSWLDMLIYWKIKKQ